MSERTVLDVQLPSGPAARAIVRKAHIIVAVAGRVCVAHRTWMDAADVVELADDLKLATEVCG